MSDQAATEPTAKPPTADALRQIAQSYMVPVSEGTLRDIARTAAPETEQAFTEQMKSQAQGLYPTFSAQIQGGLTTSHVLEPYRQVAKQLLGDQFEPDFVADPKSSAALTGGAIDKATGRATPMTLDEWRTHVKSTPEFGWQYTQQAHERANMIIRAINDGFSSPPQGRTA